MPSPGADAARKSPFNLALRRSALTSSYLDASPQYYTEPNTMLDIPSASLIATWCAAPVYGACSAFENGRPAF